MVIRMNKVSGPGFADKLRMMQWLLLSLVVYGIASALAKPPGAVADFLVGFGANLTETGFYPRVQTVLWKCGHLNLAAYVGYWIDRNAFRGLRIGRSSPPAEQIRRAIIIGASMLAFGSAL
jgi:hypothetical protein